MTSHAARQNWMRLFALAPVGSLQQGLREINNIPAYSLLRATETGLVMVQARIGNTANPFHVGESLVTRCSLMLDKQYTGHAWILGENSHHAELAALLDALCQHPAHQDALHTTLLPRLAAQRADVVRQAAAEVAPTKVDFFTMVRGEDE